MSRQQHREGLAAAVPAGTGTEEAHPVPADAPGERLRAARPALLFAGIVLASLNMRTALAGVAPVVGQIGDHFALSASGISLVTTIPLIFMGAASPLGPRLARRWGTETVLFGALVLLTCGIVLRVAPPVVALFGGCAVVGTGVALLNVLMPGLIKRDFPDRAGPMTALYSTTMILGAAVSAATAVPLERALGSWQGSLASWALLAAAGSLLWLPQVVRSRQRAAGGAPVRTGDASGDRTGGRPRLRLTRSPLAWQVTLFMGFQSLIAYVTIAWLPTILTDGGMDRTTAGLVFAFTTLMQMAGSFTVPTLAGRMRAQRLLSAAVAALMACGITGLLVDPVAGAWLWAGLLGAGQGGSLGLSLTMMALRSPDSHTAARLSGMAQTWGYLLTAAGPLAFGAVRDLTGGWTVPIALLLGVCGLLAALGMGAGRARTVDGRGDGR